MCGCFYRVHTQDIGVGLPEQLAAHGIGFGDINGDGRADIVAPRGCQRSRRNHVVVGVVPELIELAVEGRQRIRNQLHLMAPGEYGPIKLGAKLVDSGKEVVPTLPDANRVQRVSLPSKPRVGEVTGLAVIGDDRGCLLHFEVQASKGSGRIVSLGSMQKVMKESVARRVKKLSRAKNHRKTAFLDDV